MEKIPSYEEAIAAGGVVSDVTPTGNMSTIGNTIPSYEEAIAAGGVEYKAPRRLVDQQQFLLALENDDPLMPFTPSKRQQITANNSIDAPKKALMSLWFADKLNHDPQYINDNFQVVTQTYFGEKDIGVSEAWSRLQDQHGIEKKIVGNEFYERTMAGDDDADNSPEAKALRVANVYNKRQAAVGRTIGDVVSSITDANNWFDFVLDPKHSKSMLGDGLRGVTRGTSTIVSGLAASPNLAVAAAYNNMRLVNNLFWGDMPEYHESELSKSDLNMAYTIYQSGKFFKEYIETELPRPETHDTIAGAIGKGEYKKAGYQTYLAVAENIPQYAVSFIAAFFGAPQVGLATIGVSSAGSKLLQLDPYKGEGAAKTYNAIATGYIEYWTEKVFEMPYLMKAMKGIPKTDHFIKGMKFAAMTALMGAAGEMDSQLTENAIDRATGQGGNDLLYGVADAGIVSLFFDGVTAIKGGSKYSESDKALYQIETTRKVEIKKIEAKGMEMTDADRQQLDYMENSTAEELLVDNMLIKQFELLGMTPEDSNAMMAQRMLRRKANPVVDVAASSAAFESARERFGWLDMFGVVEDQSELPADVKAKMDPLGYRVRGAVDQNGKPWLVLGNIPAHEVEKVILHEGVGHIGVAGVLPEVKPFMLKLWDERAPEIKALLGKHKYEIDTGSEAGKLEAVDEYIAIQAETLKKPTWFKKLRGAVRVAIRKLLPKLRISDNELDLLLAGAGRYMNSGKHEVQSRDDVAFSLAQRKIKPSELPDNLNEVITQSSGSWLTHHKKYRAAKKEGDSEAAFDIVLDAVKHEKIMELKAMLDPNKPLYIIPVTNYEGGSHLNRLPIAYAKDLAITLDGTVLSNIVKVSNSPLSQTGEQQRLNTEHEYSGDLPKNAQFIIADDMYTSGSTTIPLVEFINDPENVFVTSLGFGKRGKGIRLTAETLDKIIKKVNLTDSNLIDLLEHATEAEGILIYGNLSRYKTPTEETLRALIDSQGLTRRTGRTQRNRPQTGSVGGQTGLVRFSIAPASDADIELATTAILPRVRAGSIKTANAVVTALDGKITKTIATQALRQARAIIKADKAKTKQQQKDEFKQGQFPAAWFVENNFPEGVAVGERFAGIETGGSYLKKNGAPIDVVAQAMKIDDQELFDQLNGLTKSSINRAYEEIYGSKAVKQREAAEKLKWRAEDIKETTADIIAGKKVPTRQLLREYPEMAAWLEDYIFDQVNSKDKNSLTLAKIAALSLPDGSRADINDLFKLLLEVQLIKPNSGQSFLDKKKLATTRQVLATYAKKFLPKDEAHLLIKYLEKDQLTSADVLRAIDEIDRYEQKGSEKKALKKRLKSLDLAYSKLTRDLINQRVSLDDNIALIAEFAKKHLPDDVRKSEINKILTRLGNMPGASDRSNPWRKIPVLDQAGNQLVDRSGEPAWEMYLDKDGKPELIATGKHKGEIRYKWHKDPTVLSKRERLVRQTFDIITKSVERSKSDGLREQITTMLKKSEVKKTHKGIETGRLEAEISTKLADIRRVVARPKSEHFAQREYLIAQLDDPKLDAMEQDQVIAELADVEMFGDLKSKSLEQLTEAVDNMSALINDGRTLYQAQMLAERAERDLNRINFINEITGMAGLDNEVAARLKKELHQNSFITGLSNFHRNHLSFELLLNNLTRANLSAETLGGAMSSQMAAWVHDATHKEHAAHRANLKKLHDELGRIFGLKGQTLLKQIEKLKVLHEKSGVMLHQGRKMSEQSLTLLEARKLRDASLQKANAQMNVNHDSGLTPSNFHAERAEEELTRLIDNAEIDNKRVVKISKVDDPGRPVEHAMTKDEAINYYLMWQQPDIRQTMLSSGSPNAPRSAWSEDSIKQIETFIGKEGMEIARFLQEHYRDEYAAINEVFKKHFHVNLPQNSNYAPASFDVTSMKDNDMLDSVPGMGEVHPGALISRKQHNRRLNQVGALDQFSNHSTQMEHFKNWAGVIKQLRGIIGGDDVRNAIIQQHGQKAYALLIEKITHLADGGNRKATSIPFVDAVRKGFTVSRLAFNPAVFVKQLTSLPAFGMAIPLKSFVKHEAEFWKNPIDNAKFLLDNSEMLGNRWAEGFDRDVARVFRDLGNSRGNVSKAIEAGMLFGKVGDILPVIVGGYAVYKHHYNKMVTDGMNSEEANLAAIREFEMVSERTQQAGGIKDLGAYQSGGSIMRLATMFITSPMQYYRYTMETFLDAVAGKKGAKKAFTKRFMITQFVLPVLFQAAADIMRNGLDFEEWDEKDYLRAITLGPLNGLFIAGKLADNIITATVNQKARYGSNFTPIWSDVVMLNHGVGNLSKLFTDGFDSDDVLKAADQLIVGTSSTNPFSAGYFILRREAKRFGLLGGKEKSRKKSTW